MRKRLLAAALALVTSLSGSVVSMAAGVSQDSAQEATQNLSVVLTAEPEYTITIPESIAMGNDGTTVDVTASGVKNMDGKKISVYISGTSAYKNQLVLEAATSPRTSIRYQIISENGEVIESNASTGAVGVGKEVVSFTEDGTKQYQILPVIAGRFEYGVAYTGSITFGIELQELQ